MLYLPFTLFLYFKQKCTRAHMHCKKNIIHKHISAIQLQSGNVKNTIKKPTVALIAFTLQLIIITIDSILIGNADKLNWIELKKEQNIRNRACNSRKMYLNFMAIVKFYRHVIKLVEFFFISIKINDKCQRIMPLRAQFW